MNRGDSRGRTLVALGVYLAIRGVTAAVALGLTLLCIVGFGVLAFILGHTKQSALPMVPILASSALAFGIGVLVAFAVSTRVFQRDDDSGVRALLTARGVHATGYLAARIAGLTLLLAVLVAGGSALTGLLTILAAPTRPLALASLQASFAAIVFSIAFALVFAPVAMATLAARSRGGGYLALLGVLVLPELLQPLFSHAIEPAWLSVLSIPGALAGLRTSLAPVGIDVAMTGRSLAVIFAIIAAALAIVRVELLRARSAPRVRPS